MINYIIQLALPTFHLFSVIRLKMRNGWGPLGSGCWAVGGGWALGGWSGWGGSGGWGFGGAFACGGAWRGPSIMSFQTVLEVDQSHTRLVVEIYRRVVCTKFKYKVLVLNFLRQNSGANRGVTRNLVRTFRIFVTLKLGIDNFVSAC